MARKKKQAQEHVEVAEQVAVKQGDQQDDDQECSNKKPRRGVFYTFDLYEDNPLHMTFLGMVEERTFGFRAVWAKHDKDVYDDDTKDHRKGDLKKVHYHMIVKMPYPMTLKNARECLCPILDFPDAAVQMVHDMVAMSQYLTHSDVKSRVLGKHQYCEEIIKGQVDILQYESRKGWCEFACALNDWACDGSRLDSWLDLCLFLEDRGMMDFVRRQGYVASQAMHEALRKRQQYEVYLSSVSKQHAKVLQSDDDLADALESRMSAEVNVSKISVRG